MDGLDPHLIAEIVLTALQLDWSFYTKAVCISKGIRELVKARERQHPKPESLKFFETDLLPGNALPESDGLLQFGTNIDLAHWQPFHYPIVNWTNMGSWDHWQRICASVEQKQWTMLRCFNKLTLGPDPCTYFTLRMDCFAEALVFETEPQPVELWLHDIHAATLAPDANGVVWLAMMPLLDIEDTSILRFATQRSAAVRFVRHVVRFGIDSVVLSLADEFGKVSWSAINRHPEFNEHLQRKWAILFRRHIASAP